MEVVFWLLLNVVLLLGASRFILILLQGETANHCGSLVPIRCCQGVLEIYPTNSRREYKASNVPAISRPM